MLDEFRQKLLALSREELLDIIMDQDPELVKQVNRIEYVFSHKLTHLTWDDGSPITERPVTKEELVLLVDEPFQPDPELSRMGISIHDQRQIHVARDPVLWAKHYLKAKPRAYQILMLRYPSNRKVLRAGRRLGKTYTMAVLLLHRCFTKNEAKCIVVAPMKSQVALIYEEILRLANKSEIVKESISRKVTSPQFEMTFSNGSTIRFFTSGIRSGGKADVVRGQEAHVIVLDELDYMHTDDLESLYAMLQQTAENQDEKLLIGASTPTGRRETFWKWSRSARFKEFWFPSYVNPYFSKEDEDEFREEYSEMGFRHEIEADWGEDSEGVYPRKYIDLAFSSGVKIATEKDTSDDIKYKSDWRYEAEVYSHKSFHIIGVDWDKYGAGTNIVILECCAENYEDPRFRDRTRVVYREEIKKDEYTLTNAVDRLIQLNNLFDPRHIYVDRGFGEVQVELLHKYGLEHPETQLRKRVVGVSFAENIEIRDPATKQMVKKELKPFMVDNLRQMLEKERIAFASSDDELYLQLISYIVVRTTQTGRPVFEAAGSAGDHAHDALILACYALYANYGELMKQRVARRSIAVSSENFQASEVSNEGDTMPVYRKRAMTVNMGNRTMSGIKRRSWRDGR